MENPYTHILELKQSNPTPAQQALRERFLNLCKTKPFASIGVTELCSKAQVARTTFYASYPNTDALLCEIEDDLIVELLRVNDHSRNKREADAETSLFTQNVLSFMQAHREQLCTLLITQPDARLIEKWKTAVKYHFWEVLGGHESSEFALEIIASVAIGGYTYLLKKPQEFDVNEMLRMMSAAIKTIQY